MKWLRIQERKYIPNTRHKKWYIILKAIILIPFLIPTYYIQTFFKWLVSKAVIKRSNGKSDIVLSNIIEGWTNLIIPNEASEHMAMTRAKICAKCPFAIQDTAVHTIVVDNKTKNIRGMKCGKCGCPLSAKVRSSKDRCPEGKW